LYKGPAMSKCATAEKSKNDATVGPTALNSKSVSVLITDVGIPPINSISL